MNPREQLTRLISELDDRATEAYAESRHPAPESIEEAVAEGRGEAFMEARGLVEEMRDASGEQGEQVVIRLSRDGAQQLLDCYPDPKYDFEPAPGSGQAELRDQLRASLAQQGGDCVHDFAPIEDSEHVEGNGWSLCSRCGKLQTLPVADLPKEELP